jgi:hypothetical protein
MGTTKWTVLGYRINSRTANSVRPGWRSTFRMMTHLPIVVTWRVYCAFVVLGTLFSCAAAAQTHRVVANSQNCKPISAAQQAWLPADWTRFHDYIRACAIRDSKGRSVLVLISVWAALYYEDQSQPIVEQVEMPRPLVFLTSGHLAGTLPANFPDAPPAELRVTFARWKNDFPLRIDFFLTDPRAGGLRSLPSLRWDPHRMVYELVE